MKHKTKSTLKEVLTWIAVGIVAVLALKLVMGLIGSIFSLIGFLLFTVGPILLLGWLAMKAWKAFTKDPAHSA